MGHYLTKVACTNCDQNALFWIHNPSEDYLGWFGGCGQMVCTGLRNFLVQDLDGSLLGEQATVIGNNEEFGETMPECGKVPHWNGYLCKTLKIGNLNFYSVAPDMNKRLFSPVTFSNDQFTTTLNSPKEWQWNGPEPLNKRRSEFISIVKLNTVIRLSNKGMNPTDSLFFLQKRAATFEDWVVIQYQFQLP